MKEFLFLLACVAVSIVVSILLVEHTRSEKFYDCLRAGESAEVCGSVL